MALIKSSYFPAAMARKTNEPFAEVRAEIVEFLDRQRSPYELRDVMRLQLREVERNWYAPGYAAAFLRRRRVGSRRSFLLCFGRYRLRSGHD